MKKISMLVLLLVCCLGTFGQNNQIVRQEVELSKIHNSTVLFTLGQSNSANYGQRQYPYTATHEVYNYFQGKLYKAQDPLLGATGTGASVWGVLGDKMIEAKVTESVTIVPIGIGSVTVGAWAKGGVHHELLLKTIDDLNNHHVKIDCICWHQGESDNIFNTSTEKYIEQFLSIREAFRSKGINAPIIIAVASYHPLCLKEDNGCSEDIRKAQKELAKRYDDIYLGPDTDKLNKCYQRADGIHFSWVGQRMHADMWLKSLRKVLKK